MVVGDREGFVSDYSMERLLPDGAVELILDLQDPAKQWREAEGARRAHIVRRSWISGQYSRPIEIEAAQDSCMIGARFRPGVAHAILDMPVSELNDAVVELDLLWDGNSRVARLVACGAIDRPALPFARRDADVSRRRPVRRRAGARPGAGVHRHSHPDDLSIRALAASIGVSQRRLVRLFEERVGLKPKTLARVMRFQKVVRLLEHDSPPPWIFVAAENGYFDQPHLITDFRAFTGMRPTEYLRAKGVYLNFVPVR